MLPDRLFFLADNNINNAQKNAAHDSYGFNLSVEELGRDAINDLADYIQKEIGHEAAAEYLKNLNDSADVFDAVDHVRNMFLENTSINDGTITEPLNGGVAKWNEQSKALVGTKSLRQRTGPGIEQLRKLSGYLDKNMVDATNGAIKTNSEVNARFLSFATYDIDPEAQKNNYKEYIEQNGDELANQGFRTWPGAKCVGGLQNLSYGPESRTWNCGYVGDGTFASRMADIEKNSLALNRIVAENYAKSGNSQMADFYNTLVEHKETNYKEQLAAYQQAGAPGELLDQVA